MKLNYEYGKDSLTITRTFEPGEKYNQALKWNDSDGKVTPEKVEGMIPGSRFIKTIRRNVFSPTLDNVSNTIVVVELTAGVEE